MKQRELYPPCQCGAYLLYGTVSSRLMFRYCTFVCSHGSTFTQHARKEKKGKAIGLDLWTWIWISRQTKDTYPVPCTVIIINVYICSSGVLVYRSMDWTGPTDRPRRAGSIVVRAEGCGYLPAYMVMPHVKGVGDGPIIHLVDLHVDSRQTTRT